MVEARARASTVVIGKTGKNVINYLEGQPLHQFKKFEDVIPTSSCDNEGMAANEKFVSTIWSDKSTVCVFDLLDFQRVQPGHPGIRCHRGAVTDLAFSPHRPELLATSCEDAKLRFFLIPDGGLKENVTEPDDEIVAHERKCTGLKWHPSVENLLASQSIDGTVKLWDVNGDGDPACTLSDFGGNCVNMSWAPDGKTIALTLKDPQAAVVADPREEDSVVTCEHGLQRSKIQWIDDDHLLVTGFGSGSSKSWSIIDLRNTSAPLATGAFASGVSLFFTYYDPGLSFMITAGRGDQTKEFFTLNLSSETFVEKVGSYKFNDNNMLFCMFPKHNVDCNNNEIARMARIGAKKTMEYHQFCIPSRQGGFNAELFPPFISNEATNTAEAWAAGTDVAPKMMQLQPKKVEKKKGKLGGKLGTKTAAATEEKKESDDPEELKQQIAQLRKELEAAKAATQAASGSQDAGAAEDTSTKPVLGYWAIRGLGHPIRMMFAYCGVDFEDVLYDVTGEPGNWDRSAWTDVKETLGLEYPNLPYLIDGETKLTETVAIMKYVARKYKPSLLGNNAAQFARLEMLQEHCGKLKGQSTMPAYMRPDGKEGDELKDHIAELCTPLLEKIMEVKGDSKFLIGDELTWLDFFLAENLDYLDTILDQRFAALIPASSEYLNEFKQIEEIKKYYESEGFMASPFNNKMAALGQE